MRKKICFSQDEIKGFYEDKATEICEGFGDFYGWGEYKGTCYDVDDGECVLCKRITDFAIEIGILGDNPR